MRIEQERSCDVAIICHLAQTDMQTHKLNMIPYGPAGIELIPNGLRSMMEVMDSIVETTDETSMNDYDQSASLVSLPYGVFTRPGGPKS